MKILRRLTLTLLLLVVVVPASVSAHGAIFTYKFIDGDNLIMVTHNVHDAQAGAPITYNIRLYTMEGQQTHFEEVEAKVLRGKNEVHTSKTPATPYEDASLIYAYPKRGNYVLSLTFLDHNKQIARAEFPIVVAAGLNNNWLANPFVAGGVGLLLGIGAAKLYAGRKRFAPLLGRLKNLRKK